MDDSEILAVEEAAARLDASSPDYENAAANLQSVVAAAVTHGKAIKDVAAAAHLTALEVLDATDAATYPGPALQPQHVAG